MEDDPNVMGEQRRSMIHRGGGALLEDGPTVARGTAGGEGGRGGGRSRKSGIRFWRKDDDSGGNSDNYPSERAGVVENDAWDKRQQPGHYTASSAARERGGGGSVIRRSDGNISGVIVTERRSNPVGRGGGDGRSARAKGASRRPPESVAESRYQHNKVTTD